VHRQSSGCSVTPTQIGQAGAPVVPCMFPVIFCRFPVIANCFPCYWAMAKSIKNRQKPHEYWAIGCASSPTGPFFPFFPVFFPVMAKNDPETGSRTTACTANSRSLRLDLIREWRLSRVSGDLAGVSQPQSTTSIRFKKPPRRKSLSPSLCNIDRLQALGLCLSWGNFRVWNYPCRGGPFDNREFFSYATLQERDGRKCGPTPQIARGFV